MGVVSLLEGIALFSILSGFFYFGIKAFSCFYGILIESKIRKILFCALGATISILSKFLFHDIMQYTIEIIYFILFSKIILKAKLFPSLSIVTLLKIICVTVEVFGNDFIMRVTNFIAENEMIMRMVSTSIENEMITSIVSASIENEIKIIYWIIKCLIINSLLFCIFRIIKFLEQKRKIQVKLHYEKISQNKKWNLFHGISFLILLNKILEIIYYSSIWPIEVLRLDSICIIGYYCIINGNMRVLEKQNILNEKIEILNFYNKNLVKTNDDVRAFKHDFNNIMQAIGGYIKFNDFEGLKVYYRDLIKECNSVKNLTLINSLAINEETLCNAILKKVEIAQDKGITVEFISFVDFQQMQIEHLGLCKIMEIMLGRAVDLAEKSESKEILVNCFYDDSKKNNVIVIASSYKESEKEKVEEEIKSETLKKEIKELIHKDEIVDLYVSLDDKLVVQELNLFGDGAILKKI